MLLDRIDIDAHGPLSRVELGPFSEQLNVICGPEGSGKTALARFIRDSLVHREYPLGMMSSSTGRVVWADRHGLVHCRREKDGTATGRRTVQVDPRGDFVDRYDSLQRTWISSVADSTDASRAAGSIQIPESIVDGVITDTAVTSVARVVSACVRSGLDDPGNFDSLPVSDPASREDDDRRRSLRAKLADVEAELARLRVSDTEYQTLTARRNELTDKLAGRRRSYQAAPSHDSSRGRGNAQLSDLERRIDRMRSRQDELRQSIAELDRQSAGRANYPHHYTTHAHHVDQDLRRKLDDLDAQLIRWRRTLTEVHALRDALMRYMGNAPYRYGADAGPFEDVVTRRQRLSGLLHSVDRYEQHSRWDPLREVSRPLSSADIELRIKAATRQIDWLLERYTAGDNLVVDWYQAVPTSTYGASTTVAETLRAIRHDLSEVRQHTHRPIAGEDHLQPRVADLDELSACEHWLSASIEQLSTRRQSLLNSYHHVASSGVGTDVWNSDDWHRERSRRSYELDRVTWELKEVMARTDELRSGRGVTPIAQRWHDHLPGDAWIDRESLVAELRQIDDRMAQISRAQWLRTRRSQLMAELGVARHRTDPRSPLAEQASRWLVRLSAGRLRRVDWPYAAFKSASLAHSIHLDRQRTGVCMDGRDESDCPAADRALAVLAVRMAAGDMLARSGRTVPLVLETHRELLQAIDAQHSSSSPAQRDAHSATYDDWNADGRSNHPLAAALHDYTRAGRQVVLLTSSETLANQINREGSRCFQLFALRSVHPHRPIWRPHYEAERYVGPHPHTYGAELAPDNRSRDQYHGETADRSRYRPSETTRSRTNGTRGVDDVNRNFDMAWREAYGLYDNPDGHSPVPETDWAADGTDLRDGYYVADSFTTNRPIAARHQEHRSDPPSRQLASRAVSKPSPFFLSVDSPIDQAPSIDAIAAARLRGLKITHINHLMQQDSNRLADALGLINVDAATIRRWQSECRLCCRVPQLRGFDSRVLVGCGVSDPAQLASIHPADLLGRVESFLATESGQRILRTGSSHELSRITSWIASARGTTSARDTAAFGPGRVVNGRVIQQHESQYAFDSDRYEYELDRDGQRATPRSRPAAPSGRVNGRRYGIGAVGGNGNGSSGNNGAAGGNDYDSGPAETHGLAADSAAGARTSSGSGDAIRSSRESGSRRAADKGRSRRSSRRRRDVVRMERAPRATDREFVDRESGQRSRGQRNGRSSGARSERQQRTETAEHVEQNSELELRFYLQRDSAVVDAPSVGARMAERLNEAGVYTVDDLLNSDPETLAAELGHRRVDAETIEAWQQQATLVCRIPMLRGHDAQLLVAAEITTTEEVAASDPGELFLLIDPISRSSEGKRIIRGGKLPDLNEVTVWINFAQQNRDLVAA